MCLFLKMLQNLTYVINLHDCEKFVRTHRIISLILVDSLQKRTEENRTLLITAHLRIHAGSIRDNGMQYITRKYT